MCRHIAYREAVYYRVLTQKGRDLPGTRVMCSVHRMRNYPDPVYTPRFRYERCDVTLPIGRQSYYRVLTQEGRDLPGKRVMCSVHRMRNYPDPVYTPRFRYERCDVTLPIGRQLNIEY